mmetsp:Transcript_13594/g.22334  ORF Transcript_13594/g.22334 Transcript_13594/m.22334 type:complete len:461 (+) Transcript_13594:71-1453(+)
MNSSYTSIIVCCTAIFSQAAAFSMGFPTIPQRCEQTTKVNMVNTVIDFEGDGAIPQSLTEENLYADNIITFVDDGPCVEVGHLIEYCPVDHTASQPKYSNALIEQILSSYIGPRVVLALVAILYGTNFSLGALMNDNLPASAATSGRMVLAALVLSPFLLHLKPNLRPSVYLGGAFVSLGYASQSIALIDTSPATVSFLGSCTVLVCPLLQWIVNKKPMGIKDAPQTWLAAFLCLSGVATLELFDTSASSSFSIAESMSRIGVGDALSLVQAVGFGVGIFMSEKMMKEEPDAALPITAGMVATTAFFSMIWCFADGWMREPGWESMGLPGLFLDPNMRPVAMAVAWTGIISTSTNFCVEITALGRVPSSEASVILATEPLWASLFAAILLHEQFGANDYIGGALMISACLVNTLQPSFFHCIVRGKEGGNENEDNLRTVMRNEGEYETVELKEAIANKLQ